MIIKINILILKKVLEVSIQENHYTGFVLFFGQVQFIHEGQDECGAWNMKGSTKCLQNLLFLLFNKLSLGNVNLHLHNLGTSCI